MHLQLTMNSSSRKIALNTVAQAFQPVPRKLDQSGTSLERLCHQPITAPSWHPLPQPWARLTFSQNDQDFRSLPRW